jgi:hypothetical protein
VRRFADDEWDRVLAAISAQLGHAAALLDGELPPEIAEDVAGTGLDLLPGGGEIGPRCTCPDEADPCKHSAAACYLIGDVLDVDPFALFLLRGRTRDQVLAGVRARRRGPVRSEVATSQGAPRPVADEGTDEGVDARAAFRAVPGGPVPAVPVPPARPGSPAVLPVDPPPWRPGLREDLIELAADAARRAWEMALGLSPDAGLDLDPDADLTRRAAHALGSPAFGVLAKRSGFAERELARQALAWRHGGQTGLELLTAQWDPMADEPDAADAADAADLLKAAGVALRIKTGAAEAVSGNRVTAGRLQLRLGRDLRWYPYTRSADGWEPSGPPAPDPVEAVAAL